MRGYDEPFRIVSGDEKKIFSEINRQGLQVVKGGKYYHLSGKHDKGQAVALLASLYQKEFENIRTIAVGNGQNDLPMLNVVDNPFFIGENENMNSVWRRIVEIALNT
jgi:mannosyl-3-phosphoglycerate phosphatase